MRALILLSLLALLGGCVSAPDVRPDDPAFAPVIEPPRPVQTSATGSIFYAGGMSLYTDRRAIRVGDILTISLDERTVSSKSADTAITKDSDISFNEANILGTLLSAKNLSLLTDLAAARDFQGEAKADQSNRLQGQIAVTVSEVLPNGLLSVRGEKWITLSNGDEVIRLRGLVRPEDVGPDNVVSSTKVADARIIYSSTGDFADANDQGWLSRALNSRYFPF